MGFKIFHGLITSIPQFEKSESLRVTTPAPLDRVMTAICASNRFILQNRSVTESVPFQNRTNFFLHRPPMLGCLNSQLLYDGFVKIPNGYAGHNYYD